MERDYSGRMGRDGKKINEASKGKRKKLKY